MIINVSRRWNRSNFDEQWARRCRQHNVDPRGVFRAHVEDDLLHSPRASITIFIPGTQTRMYGSSFETMRLVKPDKELKDFL